MIPADAAAAMIPADAAAAMILADAAETSAVGTALAALVRPGDIVTLTGPLGAGKTSIARGLLAALGLAGEAPSPSYAIVQPYRPPEVAMPVLHVDLYRLDDEDAVVELGLEDERGDGVLLVEWPDRAGPHAWPDALALMLTIEADGTRCLTATVPPAWEARWPIKT